MHYTDQRTHAQILGPDNKEIYRGERETSGKYTFAAHMDGLYTYCFSNKMSTMTPKVVLFTIEVVQKPLSPEETKTTADKTDGRRAARTRANLSEEQKKLDEMVSKLSNTLLNVQHEQEYLTVRERVHRTSECAHARTHTTDNICSKREHKPPCLDVGRVRGARTCRREYLSSVLPETVL